MKKYLLTFSLALGSVLLAQAQQKIPTATEIVSKNIEALDKKAKLNPTQKNIIYNYMMELTKEQLALAKRQQAGTISENEISKFYKLQIDNNANIKNILKGDQIAAYDDYLDELTRGGAKKKKKKKGEEEEVVTGISGLKLPPTPPPTN